MPSDRIKSIRRKIDVMDEMIVELLCARAKMAKKIAEEKKAKGLKIVDKRREKQVLAKVKKQFRKSGKPLPPKFIVNIYRQIIKECTEAEKR